MYININLLKTKVYVSETIFILFSGVLAPLALDMLQNSLKIVSFVAISCDSSNRGNQKMLPIVVRFFSMEEGVRNKMIELYRLKDETGETVFNKVKQVIENFGLQQKFICFGADNCNTNFGGVQRGGDHNVFHRLQEEYGQDTIGIGCNAHLAHKSIEQACHKFQQHFDIEAIIVKIYGYFKHITVRNTRLQELCSDDEDIIKLLGYSNTRFIGMKNCIGRILKYYELLKTFFTEEEEEAPIDLVRFFEHKLSKMLLIFVHDQCQLFEKHIKAIEGNDVSGYEACKNMKHLVEEIESRKEENFESVEFAHEMVHLIDVLPFQDTIMTKKRNGVQYTEVMVDLPYLKEMFHRFYGNLFRNQNDSYSNFTQLMDIFFLFRSFTFVFEEMAQTFASTV